MGTRTAWGAIRTGTPRVLAAWTRMRGYWRHFVLRAQPTVTEATFSTWGRV
jgi:hypothetical protein